MREESTRRRAIATGEALCVSLHAEAAEAGAAMLRRDGNAFDAAVAAGFVEAVVSPNNCGIGGYGAAGIGFLASEGKVVSLDADGIAPRAASERMFPTMPDRDPNHYRLVDDAMRRGPLSVTVPGVLGGLLTMLDRWGRLPRAVVMAPAIEHARRGVVLPAAIRREWLALTGRTPASREADPKARVPMPGLADTLEAIALEGQDLFYAGRIGRAIADSVRRLGGILTPEDMAAYEVRVVAPIGLSLHGYQFWTSPPPAGGLTSLQILALLGRLDLRDGPDSLTAYEALLESLKVAWETRLTTLADPAWMKTPPADHLADEALDRLLQRVRDGLAHPGPGRVVAPDPLGGTVHLAAADAAGNAVAWTQTHGGGFGSGLMVPGLEVVLGHGMCRFEPRPGWANSVAPGKRPLHNMCPIIALRDGRAVLAVGGAGGRTIVTNVAATLTRRVIHGQDAARSLRAPRLLCETIEPAKLERAAGPDVIEGLRSRGHRVDEVAQAGGVVHWIERSDAHTWLGIGEPRSVTVTVVVA